jgi:hypothetical protein
MALGRGTNFRLAESIPATARALRETEGPSRGILILGVRSDLLERSCKPRKRSDSIAPCFLFYPWIFSGDGQPRAMAALRATRL